MKQLPRVNARVRRPTPRHMDYGQVTIVDHENEEFYVLWSWQIPANGAAGPYTLDEATIMGMEVWG